MSIIDTFHSRREVADDEIMTFLSEAKNYKIIFFDVETNGFVTDKPFPSVLSISAIKGEIISKNLCPIIDKYSRYYFPREEYKPDAIKVNGLDYNAVYAKRTESSEEYPQYFDEDYKPFLLFCNDVKLFVGHNAVEFDSEFIPFIDWKSVKIFDTMTSNRDIVCYRWLSEKNQWKNPKLIEAANFYEIKSEESQLHGSLYDAEIAMKIFLEMLKRSTIRLKKFE